MNDHLQFLLELPCSYRQAIVVAMNQTYLMELMLGAAKPESIILLKHMSKVSYDGSTIIRENQ
jgi:hypothetical protein